MQLLHRLHLLHGWRGRVSCSSSTTATAQTSVCQSKLADAVSAWSCRQAPHCRSSSRQHGWLGRSCARLMLLWVLALPGCLFLPCFCSTIYNMCTQKPPYDYSEQLYQRYKDAFNTYINDMVGGTHPDLCWAQPDLAGAGGTSKKHSGTCSSIACPWTLGRRNLACPAHSTAQRAPGQDAAQSC